VSAGEQIEIITDKTPFYAESGGQVGDLGTISSNGNLIQVTDTQKPLPEIVVHVGVVQSGEFKIQDTVQMKVSNDRRHAIMANHSATHILQWALRSVLGDHVNQSGSLVEADRLRFDFTHFSSITPDELNHIETLVNEKIRENVVIASETIDLDQAINSGATALFGEKYGDKVRVISMGDFSRELCGGTHARRTGDIGLFKIMSEGGIAAGVRRIEAVTGRGALEYVRMLEVELKELALKLRGSRGELIRKLDKLFEEKKYKDKEIEVLKARLASGKTSDLMDGVEEINGIKVLAKLLDGVSNPKDLREYADRVKEKLGSGVALLAAKTDEKALLLAAVSKDLTDRYHAGKIVKRAAEVLGGSGGGRPDMAQAGGPNLEKIEEALNVVHEFVN
jgi:alanyl-tRNA synthetase